MSVPMDAADGQHPMFHIKMANHAGLAHFLLDLHSKSSSPRGRRSGQAFDVDQTCDFDEVLMMTTGKTEKTTKDKPRGRSPDPLALAKAEMAEGEVLVWADTSSRRNARRRVLPVSLLGWLFLLLALSWMARAAIASFWLLIMGLPFLLAILALALLPWWWPHITRHTVYAISNRRLLIIQNWLRRKVTSYGPDDIDVVERQEHRDGSGDLIFRREIHPKLRHHHDHRNKNRVSERPVGFFGVPDVRRLEEALWALKERRTPVVDDDRGDQPDSDRTETAPPPSSPPPAAGPKDDRP